MNSLYRLGFGLMEGTWFPGSLSMGAALVRAAREIDTNEGRQLAAWDRAKRILAQHQKLLR